MFLLRQLNGYFLDLFIDCSYLTVKILDMLISF